MAAMLHGWAMDGTDPGPAADYATLAEFLAALAYPTRLALLEQLRFPHTLGEIRIAPHRREGGQMVDRPVARQTVLGHLEQLVAVGLVQAESVEAEGRQVPRYAVNASRLYELSEELVRLTTRYAGAGGGAEATSTVTTRVPRPPARGPRLVLVHGVYEGKVFAFSGEAAGVGPWILGRRRDAAVSLDYDPFVSLEHAVVTQEGRSFVVNDLGSKNGTTVNWEPLAPGRPHALRPGDVLGVGRSRLCFAEA
jgi:DNA-binding transcriptional ArsR family regulator